MEDLLSTGLRRLVLEHLSEREKTVGKLLARRPDDNMDDVLTVMLLLVK